MPKIVVDIPVKYDKLLKHLKADREFSTKGKVIEKIVETFFKKEMDLE